MIARLAFSPEALRALGQGGTSAEIFGRHSAILEAVEAHGVLVFGSDKDRVDLVQAIKETGPETAAMWAHLLKRFNLAGRYVKATPPSATSLDELSCVEDLRSGWGTSTDVVLVGEARATNFGIPPGAMTHLDPPSGIESSLAPAAPFVGALAHYKGTRNKQVLAEGAEREDLWRNTLLPIVRLAKHLVVFDRYLFRHLANRDRGGKAEESFVSWFMKRANAEARRGCEITLMGWDHRPNGDPVDAAAAAALVQRVFGRPAGRIRSIDVVTSQPASYLPHDRHISTNLNVGVSFSESFDSLDGDYVSSEEGVEYSYRFDPVAVDKLQTAERRFQEDRSATRVNAYTRA